MSLLFFPSLSDLQWEFILRAVQISSYIPGRIRLRSGKLVGNTELSKKLSTMAAEYPEIRKLEINTVTGSALILYNTQAVRANSRFAKVEQYIKMHAERRG
ncbi:HMA2 domain-containing protein [uncultured Megasphaera sp.]|uniref:HMA2 domain-containing protein n=1 Tax=uncultured Megasphaera sp. TaxID=165188 RepID=UPI0025956FB8|nr:hypothetical protein [uncultured Megasphaera sp.]